MVRKRMIKNMSLDELVKEQQRALSTLETLREYAIETITSIDEALSKLNIQFKGSNIDSKELPNPNNVRNMDFSKYSPYPEIDNKENKEDDSFKIKGEISSDGGTIIPGVELINIDI